MANEVDIIINSKNNAGGGFKEATSDAKAYGNGLEGVGERADKAEMRTLGLKDTVDGVATIMQGPGKQGIASYIQGWADLAGGLANFVIPSLIQVATAEGRAAIASAISTAGQKAAAAASKAFAAAQWLVNAALSANPIGLIIVGLIALGVALVIAYKKSSTFRAIVQAAFKAVQVAGRILWAAIKTYFSAIGAAFSIASRIAGTVASTVRSRFSSMVSFIRGIPGRIRGAFGGLYNIITAPVRNAVGAVRSWLNGLVSFARSIPSKIGGFAKGLIPGFAHGGVVGQAANGGGRSGPTLTGEHGPELLNLPPGTSVRSNSDTRRTMGRGGGSGGVINIVLNLGGRAFGKIQVDTLRKEVRTLGGDVQAVLGS